MREDKRKANELRTVEIVKGFQEYPEGSALINWGNTRVICAAHMDDKVPPFIKGSGQGWITAEYSMLPGATQGRARREHTPSGRSSEIQRLIGRSLRACCDLSSLGEISIIIDCDVLQADGGTRCASITGGFVALALAVKKLMSMGIITRPPVLNQMAAVSAGIVMGEALLDLDYDEDSRAGVDANFVFAPGGLLAEIQGTAEGRPFSREQLLSLLDLSSAGAEKLFELQRNTLGEVLNEVTARNA